MAWQVVITPAFEKTFRKIRDRKVSEIIKKGMGEIQMDPYHNSKVIIEKKTRSRRAGKYRILYQPCEDCRLRRVDHLISCAGCDDIPDKTIVFFDFQLRKENYD